MPDAYIKRKGYLPLWGIIGLVYRYDTLCILFKMWVHMLCLFSFCKLLALLVWAIKMKSILLFTSLISRILYVWEPTLALFPCCLHLAQGDTHLYEVFGFFYISLEQCHLVGIPWKILVGDRFLIKGTLGEVLLTFFCCPWCFLCPCTVPCVQSLAAHLQNGTVNLPCCSFLSVFAVYIENSCTGCSSYLCCTWHAARRSLGGVFDNFVNTTITSKHGTFCTRD